MKKFIIVLGGMIVLVSLVVTLWVATVLKDTPIVISSSSCDCVIGASKLALDNVTNDCTCIPLTDKEKSAFKMSMIPPLALLSCTALLIIYVLDNDKKM